MGENSFGYRFKKAFNVLLNKDHEKFYRQDIGSGYYYRPDRPRLTRGNERSIATAILNRISLDASSVIIQHCKVDEEGRFLGTIDSKLNNCLNVEANIDQTSRAYMHDVVMSMLDEGVVGMFPIDTDHDPEQTGSYDILTMRTARIIEWFPAHVRVNAYNDRTGQRQEVTVAKRTIGIVENPFYAVMNEPNSTMQRLIRKLNLMDAIDEHNGSNKLDLIVQIPYILRSEQKRQQADKRLKSIEEQLRESPYGIAYTDGTEKITQLNRPVENNLLKQIEYLTNMLYGQLGITQSIMDGTADEKTMLNYYTRTIEPIVSAIVDEMKRKFLTQTARSQGQSIMFFRDTFKLTPITEFAESADKLTRNEIMTKNEVRQKLGMKPSDDPKADMLINSNISQSPEALDSAKGAATDETKEGESQNGEI